VLKSKISRNQLPLQSLQLVYYYFVGHLSSLVHHEGNLTYKGKENYVFFYEKLKISGKWGHSYCKVSLQGKANT